MSVPLLPVSLWRERSSWFLKNSAFVPIAFAVYSLRCYSIKIHPLIRVASLLSRHHAGRGRSPIRKASHQTPFTERTRDCGRLTRPSTNTSNKCLATLKENECPVDCGVNCSGYSRNRCFQYLLKATHRLVAWKIAQCKTFYRRTSSDNFGFR